MSNAIRKPPKITIEEFLEKYKDTRCEFHNGEVIGEGLPLEAQATTADHGSMQAEMVAFLISKFGRRGGPDGGGRWWFITEAAVRYGTKSFFAHDIAGWKRNRVPKRPSGFPILERPDWVCEILSSNHVDDTVRKKNILHQWEVPYYWIADPLAKTLVVHEWAEKGYISVVNAEADFKGRLPPFHDLEMTLADVFGIEEGD